MIGAGSASHGVGARLGHEGTELGAQSGPEIVGRAVAAAAPGDEGLDLLLNAVFAQARRALVEVVLDGTAALVGALQVQEQVDLVQDLPAVDLMSVATAHGMSPPG